MRTGRPGSSTTSPNEHFTSITGGRYYDERSPRNVQQEPLHEIHIALLNGAAPPAFSPSATARVSHCVIERHNLGEFVRVPCCGFRASASRPRISRKTDTFFHHDFVKFVALTGETFEDLMVRWKRRPASNKISSNWPPSRARQIATRNQCFASMFQAKVYQSRATD